MEKGQTSNIEDRKIQERKKESIKIFKKELFVVIKAKRVGHIVRTTARHAGSATPCPP